MTIKRLAGRSDSRLHHGMLCLDHNHESIAAVQRQLLYTRAIDPAVIGRKGVGPEHGIRHRYTALSGLLEVRKGVEEEDRMGISDGGRLGAHYFRMRSIRKDIDYQTPFTSVERLCSIILSLLPRV